MNLREFLEPDRESREWEWWIVAVCFFLLGGLWGVIAYQRHGVGSLGILLLLGILFAGFGFAAGRLARYAARVVRLRSDNLGVSPVVATVLMIAITILLAVVLYLMISGILGG